MTIVNAWDLTVYTGTGEYDSCERSAADIRIYHDNGTHQEVTAILNVEPTAAHNIGDTWVTSRGQTMEHKHTLWSYSTEHLCESLDLRDHLDVLLSIIDERIRTVQSLPEVKMTVHCIWWSKGSGGPTLSSRNMRRLGELGLECSFDVSI